MEEDAADRHVARWRDHWIDVPFDDDVEAIVTRMSALMVYFRASKQRAVAEVGLQEFEYDTLHKLMIRDTPGHASPSRLAEDLGISYAGMTGRMDSMVEAGWVQRRPSEQDRRRVEIEVTKAGVEVWRRAMDLRGHVEEDLVHLLDDEQRATLSALLKIMTMSLETARD